MGRSQRPGSQLQRPKRAVKSLTNRYLLAPEQASSTTLRAYRARAQVAQRKASYQVSKGQPARPSPTPADKSLRLLRPWPPSLPREAGGAGEGRARAGGEYLLVRRLPSSRLLPSFLPGRATPGGARLLQCVYERESTRTPLCHYRRTQLLFTEKSVRTRPPRGDRRDDCVPAHGNTPHSCARGWTFKTCPLTPPRAALVARSGSPGDAEPCCYPLLRKRFSGTRYVALGLVPVYLRWVQRGVCVCAPCSRVLVLPIPGYSTFSTSPGVSSLPRLSGPQTDAHRLPRPPAPRARTRCGCVLPSVCLAPRQGWRPMAAPAFVSSGSRGSECARSWDTPLPGSSQAPPSPPSHTPPR